MARFICGAVYCTNSAALIQGARLWQCNGALPHRLVLRDCQYRQVGAGGGVTLLLGLLELQCDVEAAEAWGAGLGEGGQL